MCVAKDLTIVTPTHALDLAVILTSMLKLSIEPFLARSVRLVTLQDVLVSVKIGWSDSSCQNDRYTAAKKVKIETREQNTDGTSMFTDSDNYSLIVVTVFRLRAQTF